MSIKPEVGKTYRAVGMSSEVAVKIFYEMDRGRFVGVPFVEGTELGVVMYTPDG